MQKLLLVILAMILSFSCKQGDPPKLMRFLSIEDVAVPVKYLEPLDAFVYNHIGYHEIECHTLQKGGLDGYRYFNVLTAPLPEWVDPSAPWFHWVDSVIVREWDAVIDSTRFIAFGNPLILDWTKITPSRGEQMAYRQLALIRDANVYLDQFWYEPADWMCNPIVPLPDSALWRANISYYLDFIRLAHDGIVLVNGDDSVPPPILLENADWSWEKSVKLWRLDYRNVLMVDYTSVMVDQAIQVWVEGPGALAFSGSRAETQAAYDRAEAVRRGVYGD